ncbi:MAG: FtsX-like permease family protein [Hellea sp.]
MTDMLQQSSQPQPLLSAQSDNARSLVIVLTIMAFLAALALLFSLSADRLRKDWQGELGRSATVQIMVDSVETREANIQTALKVLRPALPGAEVKLLSETQSKSLLKPWLGNLELPDDLPLPALISISQNGGAVISPDRLTALLGEDGIIAEVDDHSRWSDQIGRSGRGLQAAALALLALIFGAGIAVSGFATQAALSAQRDVIRVLVQVGAEDGFIARLFIKQAGIRGLKGAIIGVVLGTITALFLSLRRAEETALLPDLGLHWTDSIFLVFLILGFTFICSCAAGVTAYRLLRRERRRA